MRDLLNDLEASNLLSDPDPVRRAQSSMVRPLPKRFYKDVSVAPMEGGYAVHLDGKPVRNLKADNFVVYQDKGKQPVTGFEALTGIPTSGLRAPRVTARVSTIISFIVAGTVESWPSTVIAAESPTRTTSTPAASATVAEGLNTISAPFSPSSRAPSGKWRS